MASRRSRQQSLQFHARGGVRQGAGRKRRAPRKQVAHRVRPRLDGRTPVHITLRMVPAIANLRRREQYRAIRQSLARTADRGTLRICHYSVQRNHVHLIAEPHDREVLTRGMSSFETSCARRLNRALGRRGRVFADRYHAQPLRTPAQVRNAIVYVLNNWRHHGEVRRHPGWRTDRYSSADLFDGWTCAHDWKRPTEPLPVVAPEMWLLAEGWRRHGAIDPEEVPAAQTCSLKPVLRVCSARHGT